MLNWICRIKATLRPSKGETIIEAIVSLLVFSALLLGVTAILETSMIITRDSAENARALQENIINPAVLLGFDGLIAGGEPDEEEPGLEFTTIKITFTAVIDDGVSIVNTQIAEHDARLYSKDGIMAFEPEVELEPEVDI